MSIPVTIRKTAGIMVLVTTCIWLLAACAASDGLSAINTGQGLDGGDASKRITACKSTDTLIDDSRQCLQDDAACYQISSGQWCTGERGSVCPAGSVELPAGQSCPAGKRCFRLSESMECTIN